MQKNKYHFVGIGGIGMSGLAEILLRDNHIVSGSDCSQNKITQRLKALGATIYCGHNQENVPKDASVVYSSGIDKSNPELIDQLPLLHRSDLLNLMLKEKISLLVAGTHGKTTTTALLAYTFEKAGKDPSYALGGLFKNIERNAKRGRGKYFIAEADESDRTHIKYVPDGLILTNIECDHMENYRDKQDLISSFQTLAKNTKKQLIWCGDDPVLRKINLLGYSYGFDKRCDFCCFDVFQKGFSTDFSIRFKNTVYHFNLNLIGLHNVLNATAVFALAISFGIEKEVIAEAFKTFPGVKRRLEIKKQFHDTVVIDDYAHHPTEIKTTLNGIRKAIGKKRLITIVQPHRYSRVKDCLEAFGTCFDETDLLWITDIYSPPNEKEKSINTLDLVKCIKKKYPHVLYCPFDQLVKEVEKKAKIGDVIVTFGAGTITHISDQINPSNFSKIKVGVIFGGKSLEHDISYLSAENIDRYLDRSLYDITFFGITKKGKWTLPKESLKEAKKEILQGYHDRVISCQTINALQSLDIAFPILHGPNGEDGILQGFLETLDVPYIGCNHLSSALCMDKALIKQLCKHFKIPTLPFLSFDRRQWKKEKKRLLKKTVEMLKFPVFVKPCRLGSSVGIEKVKEKENLSLAVDRAFEFDEVILIEQGVQAREIEFAVIGKENITVFPPGEVLTEGKFYDYQAKYGKQAFQSVPKADLPLEKIEKGKKLAKKVYQMARCQGLARIDFFLDMEGNFWLNEVNPIPGFTKNSLFPKICQQNNLGIDKLCNDLIFMKVFEFMTIKRKNPPL